MAGVRQFDEEAMLEQALELFWQKGFANTTMQDLAAATGVQRGSLYNAYGNKDTLFLKVFERYRLAFLEQMRDALAPPNLRDALRSFFDFVISSMTTGIPTRGCLSTKTALGSEVLDPSLQSALRLLLDDIEAALVERLSVDSEGLPVHVRQAARLIVTFTRGLVVIERVYAEEKRMRASADALVKLLLPSAASGR
jgi:TetR/AcrR family transcriptional regulator, transcriptional repressor for nem operon